MPLSEQQLLAIRVFDWFLSDSSEHRQSGRTTAMAIALIRQAAENPGRCIRYLDHYGAHRGRMFMRDFITALATSDHDLQPHFESRSDYFRLNLQQPMHDWMPSEHDWVPSGRYQAFDTPSLTGRRQPCGQTPRTRYERLMDTEELFKT